MEKRAKLFWRYMGPLLVVVEAYIYVLFINNRFASQIACVAFVLVNSIIVTHLIQVKLKVEKHNAAINAAEQGKNRAVPADVTATAAVVPAM